MAFLYRKRDPGSGGARIGANRRPDIPEKIRIALGAYCTDLYAEACADHHKEKWLNELLEDWEQSNPSMTDRRKIHDDISNILDLNTIERKFINDFAYYPNDIYTDNGGLIYKYADVSRITEHLSVRVYGYLNSPQLNGKLPRVKIPTAKRRVILKAKSYLASNRVHNVSDGFIKTCWIEYTR